MEKTNGKKLTERDKGVTEREAERKQGKRGIERESDME